MFDSVKSSLENLELQDDQSVAFSIVNIDTQDYFQFNEEENFYPASLIKLFAAVLAYKKFPDSKSLDEFSQNDIKVAIRNSLEESDNDALSLVYDFVSDSNSGLYDKKTFPKFSNNRKSLAVFFKEQGFSDELAIHNKCYSFAPYGKDLKLFLNEGSNKSLVGDIDKIMLLIIKDYPELLESMVRDGSCVQSEFIYKGLDQSKLDFFYSKAAWTTSVRHDTAYFSYLGKKYLVTILTKGLSDNKEFIPELSSRLFLN